jgi:predicted transcriptional regulator
VSDLGSYSRVVGQERVDLGVDMRAKYEAGASIRELTEEVGRSYGFVHRVLLEAGTTLRGRGGQHKVKDPAEAAS